MENAEGWIMKPCFILICYLTNPLAFTGDLKFSNVNNCTYFRDKLDGQIQRMGDQERHMSCICKLTSVPEKTRLY